MNLLDILNASKDYINSEFSIKIYKQKGDLNTKQIYYGNPAEIGTCIASMIEQLVKNEVFTISEIKYVVNLGLDKLKKEGYSDELDT